VVPPTALDAVVDVQGVDGSRSVPLTQFYVLPGERPNVENVLQHGELITRIRIPLLPLGMRSGYLKVRDRTSYEFTLVSAAAALLIEDGMIVRARLALGGVGTMPWRALDAEEILHGAPATGRTFRAAAQVALADPFTVPGTASARMVISCLDWWDKVFSVGVVSVLSVAWSTRHG
jgi:CO/xanthine dehydrogenase FAD-binding subunit